MATIRFRDRRIKEKREIKQKRVTDIRKKLTITRVVLALSIISNAVLAHFVYQDNKTVINSTVIDFITKYFNN
jgi:hypothetical protein